MVRPAPKQYPPKNPSHLRKISVTLNFSKIFEQFLAEAMVLDMTPSSDPSQYGNEKGISTQHYLIKMVDRILTSLDSNKSNEAYAVLLNRLEPSQCPKMGINSFY